MTAPDLSKLIASIDQLIKDRRLDIGSIRLVRKALYELKAQAEQIRHLSSTSREVEWQERYAAQTAALEEALDQRGAQAWKLLREATDEIKAQSLALEEAQRQLQASQKELAGEQAFIQMLEDDYGDIREGWAANARWKARAEAAEKQRAEARQQIAQLEKQLSEARKDVDYHNDCRPNRRKAEQAMADAMALADWRADVTVALSRPGGAFFEDVPGHIRDIVKELAVLREALTTTQRYVDGVTCLYTQTTWLAPVSAEEMNRIYRNVITQLVNISQSLAALLQGEPEPT